MHNLADNKRRKSSVPLIAMRLNMTLIACQYPLNACAMLDAKDILERSDLFVTTYSQDISRSCRFVHPTCADRGDNTNRLQQECHTICQHFADCRIFQHQILASKYGCDCAIAAKRTTD